MSDHTQVLASGMGSCKGPFCSCSAPGISFFFTFFWLQPFGRFHSPVHDGSVDVDEIDDDLKAEDALDDDNEFVATK